jgi:hypothetical protein
VPTAQLPLRHAAAALGTAQRRSQAPQCRGVGLRVDAGAGAAGLPEGQARVALQPVTQRLPTQRLPEGQCSSVTQSTHARVVVSQRREARAGVGGGGAGLVVAAAGGAGVARGDAVLARRAGVGGGEALHAGAGGGVADGAAGALPAQSALVAQRKGASTGPTSRAGVGSLDGHGHCMVAVGP